LSGGQTGLLGADEAAEGAVLISFPEDKRIALCRHRAAGEQADMSEHWRATGGPH